jgi:exosortase E/protease (VPEID-CTERM system)
MLAVEFLGLSLLVDWPTTGPALRLVEALRVAVPVVIGALAAGWVLGRGHARRLGADERRAAHADLPPWRPLPALAIQPVAFAATAAFAHRLMAPGAPPVGVGALAAWLAAAGGTVLLAIVSAAPLGWTARRLAVRWRAPLLALALGLLVWRAAAAAEGLWGVLSAGTLRAVVAVLGLAGGEVTVDPSQNLVGWRGFEVLIAPVCSGADGLGLVVTFQVIWIVLARDQLHLWRALPLVVAGAVAALGANVLRIAALVLLGGAGREELAMGGFHSKLGWLLFIAIALASVAIAERVPWFRRQPGGLEPELPPAHDAACIAPLVATLGTALVTGLWAEGALDLLYGARVAAAGGVLLLFRRSLPALAPSRSPLPALLGAAAGIAWVVAAVGDARPLGDAVAGLAPATRAAWIVGRAAGAVVLIPIVEELAFRGFLLGWLGAPRPAEAAEALAWGWPAALLSSLAFGALHQHWLLGTLAGLAFAAARVWRGRLGDAVLAHVACNAVVAVAVGLQGRWDLWA